MPHPTIDCIVAELSDAARFMIYFGQNEDLFEMFYVMTKGFCSGDDGVIRVNRWHERKRTWLKRWCLAWRGDPNAVLVRWLTDGRVKTKRPGDKAAPEQAAMGLMCNCTHMRGMSEETGDDGDNIPGTREGA
ncbi:hypothetical protein F5888DRAFT_1885595 [Russula emetica]|nr:hypothetical protein F5888DRAFT_1885595 [Russula emetica]